MKLFIIAALVAVSYAARLEHLEQQQQLRAYLPPHQGSGFGPSGHGNFGSNGAFGPAGAGQLDSNARAAFPSTSSQYLPPDHGPSAFAASGSPDFAGSLNGFGAQNQPSQYGQQPIPAQQYGQASQFGQQDASAQGTSPFGAQAGFQPAANSQYTAPHSSQNIPQQPFDEQTGYHY